MFESLKKHDIILVTGPQRSGTTICARMIAHDTGHTYIDEARFITWDAEKALQIAQDMAPSVVQGPGLLLRAHEFDNVIFMRRLLKDIEASLRKSPGLTKVLSFKYFPALITKDPPMFLPAIMYAAFYAASQDKIKNLNHVSYEHLNRHHLWVPKEERVGWKSRQWQN